MARSQYHSQSSRLAFTTFCLDHAVWPVRITTDQGQF